MRLHQVTLYSGPWRAGGTGGGCFICTYSPLLAGSTASCAAPQGREGRLTVTLLQDPGKSVSEGSPVLYLCLAVLAVSGSDLSASMEEDMQDRGLVSRAGAQARSCSRLS